MVIELINKIGVLNIMRKIIITTASVTIAMKAKRLLEAQNFNTRLVKIDNISKSKSCTHGIEIDYKDFLAAVSILKSNNIPYNVGV